MAGNRTRQDRTRDKTMKTPEQEDKEGRTERREVSPKIKARQGKKRRRKVHRYIIESAANRLMLFLFHWCKIVPIKSKKSFIKIHIYGSYF
jgi:hypothetical protein